ncbi:glycosyltransferase family 2 protein [Gramella sp. AN32]|uniref:Glycosyltransferase family 2 protein n=1 Tax=Christiangramia antarctica TaxID=2058158 RepID=A0ABW5X5X7_9FLAO|nr:glycosyltransferase family 2 protein [Gramella sp. AN32]MCM4154590.1 dTDP-Rha--alpha-D-GlcNAc-pyrophosphate polyprenol alpha-3-L-rhamnosyltransferase [Gramella sp. AN32]
MDIAVLILNWNGKELLKQFLPSVVKYSEQAALYVIDNDSTDGSVSFLKQHYPEIKIIKHAENLGYAGGYNQALKRIPENISVLLNSDVEVTENWLKPFLSIFEKFENVAAIQPKILDYRRKDYFEYAGAAGGFIDKFGYPYCRGRIFESLEKDVGQYDQEIPVFWASGACLVIRTEIFNKYGGLDEDFFAHQEEIDLCWRLHNKGYTIKFTPKSKVYHVGGATLQQLNPKKTFFNYRNSLYMLLKNLPIKDLYIILFARMILDGVAAVKFLFEGKLNHISAIFKAHLSFYRNFSVMKRKRKVLENSEKYYNATSVVYAHFIKRKSKFDQI